MIVMGARGPMKIQPHLQVVSTEGTVAATVQPIAPEKPKAVREIATLSEIWDELVRVLEDDGMLARSDAMAMEMCARHFWLAREASAEAGGHLTLADTVHGGTKKNPAEAVFRAESAMFLRYAQQLGLTFASRARTPAKGATSDESDDENPFAAPAL